MTNIDIIPEAVERLIASFEEFCLNEGIRLECVSQERAALRALSAALTQSRAETAAAYERAAKLFDDGTNVTGAAIGRCIRALATHDQSSAIADVIADAKAEALSGPWEDKPDALTDALELVSNRHGNGALVGLVNYLMAQNKSAESRGMRKAAVIAYQFEGNDKLRCAILAAIPQGEMK